jgi:MFS superfamily sulfate permease-like transporter
VGSLVLILLLKRFDKVPGILIAVVVSSLCVVAFDLDRVGVKVLGTIPQGLPAFALPWMSGADIVRIVGGSFAVALIAFADTSVLSRTFAIRTHTRVDPNQEMIGLGVLFRWDAPLFFANAELFQQRVIEATAQAPAPVKRVVVAAEPVTSVDVTSADMLGDLHRALKERGIELISPK